MWHPANEVSELFFSSGRNHEPWRRGTVDTSPCLNPASALSRLLGSSVTRSWQPLINTLEE